VFHQSDNRVAKPAQLGGLAAVTFAVVGDLLAPPFAVALRLGVAARAAVPKTAVHEDSNVEVGEHQIGLARQPTVLRGMSDSETSGDSAHSTLGCGALGWLETSTQSEYWGDSSGPAAINPHSTSVSCECNSFRSYCDRALSARR